MTLWNRDLNWLHKAGAANWRIHRKTISSLNIVQALIDEELTSVHLSEQTLAPSSKLSIYQLSPVSVHIVIHLWPVTFWPLCLNPDDHSDFLINQQLEVFRLIFRCTCHQHLKKSSPLCVSSSSFYSKWVIINHCFCFLVMSFSKMCMVKTSHSGY